MPVDTGLAFFRQKPLPFLDPRLMLTVFALNNQTIAAIAKSMTICVTESLEFPIAASGSSLALCVEHSLQSTITRPMTSFEVPREGGE
jgi:hypothetical protein